MWSCNINRTNTITENNWQLNSIPNAILINNVIIQITLESANQLSY
jgi:hypothetical protein